MAGGRYTHPRLQTPSASPAALLLGDWSCRLQRHDNNDASCLVLFIVRILPTSGPNGQHIGQQLHAAIMGKV